MSVHLRGLLAAALLLGGHAGSPCAESDPPGKGLGQARVDAHGDPLPPDALARLGTVRLRHVGIITSLAFSANGKALVSGAVDGTVCVWNLANGRRLGHFNVLPPGEMSQYVDIMSQHVVIALDGSKAVAANYCLPVLWDVTTGKQLRGFGDPKSGVQVLALAVSADGKTLACGKGDGTLLLWDMATGKELCQVKGGGKEVVSCLAFAPDGKTLASADESGKFSLWDVTSGRRLRQWQGPDKHVYALAFSPRGDALAAALKHTVRLLEVKTWTPRRSLIDHSEGEKGVIRALAFSPDGRLLASGSEDRTICLWDLTSGKEVRRCRGHQDAVSALAFSADGKTLASGGWDSTVRLWDVSTGKERRPQLGHQHQVKTIAFDPGGKALLSGGCDGTLRRWDLTTGKEHSRALALRGGWPPLAISPDGAVVATAEGEPAVAQLRDAATGKLLRTLGQPGDANGRMMAFSAHGKLLATISEREDVSRLCLWDVATGTEVRRSERCVFGVGSIAVSPDNKVVAMGDLIGQLRLWHAATGKELHRLEHDGLKRTGYVWTVTFSPDGRTVAATSSQNRAIRLWEVATGQQRFLLTHDDELRTLAFAPDGRSLASGGFAGLVYLWDVTTGAERGRLMGHQGAVWAVAFAPDGERLASGSADTTVLLWDAAALLRRTRRQPVALPAKELEALWRLLGGADGERAYQVIGRLANAPTQAVPFLRGRLRPAPIPDAQQAQRIRCWLADLDSPRFGVRDTATRGLRRLGKLALSALREALPDAVGLEKRRRLEGLLARLEEPVLTAETLRGLRAVEALEYTGTEEARRLLGQLASGGAHARLTREARESLERLARRGR